MGQLLLFDKFRWVVDNRNGSNGGSEMQFNASLRYLNFIRDDQLDIEENQIPGFHEIPGHFFTFKINM